MMKISLYTPVSTSQGEILPLSSQTAAPKALIAHCLLPQAIVIRQALLQNALTISLL